MGRKAHNMNLDLKTKRCSKCLEVLHFDLFSKKIDGPGGRRSECKKCARLKSGIPEKYIVKIDYGLRIKSCTYCKKFLFFEDFYRSTKGTGGLSPRCRSCTRLIKGSISRVDTKLSLVREEKMCTRCEKVLPFKCFYKKKTGKGGRFSICKNCIQLRRNKRRLTDINYRLAAILRTRMCKIVRRECKSGSAVRDLGCSIDKFRAYLEKRFYTRFDGTDMTWDNYGQYGWHVDHIKPLVSFDLTDRCQFLKAVHYTNMQPLWCEDNFTKGAKEDYDYGKKTD